MSRSNRIGKELARERVAKARIEAERKAARTRRTVVYGSTLGVILLAIILAIVINNAVQPTAPPLFPTASVADTTGGVSAADGMAVPIGDSGAPVKLTVYEDFRCSACGQFEKTFQTAYKALVKSGAVELLIHPVDLIDNNVGGSGSLAAGNASACAQNAGKFQAFHDVLYANQPQESTDSFGSNATLISFAKQVSGLDSPTFESCVNSGKYDGWVKQNYRDLEQVDGTNVATPTLLANGTKLSLTTPAAFTTQLQQMAAKIAPSAAPSSASAAASGSASAAASGAPGASSSAAPSPTASK